MNDLKQGIYYGEKSNRFILVSYVGEWIAVVESGTRVSSVGIETAKNIIKGFIYICEF